jgi:outer membrane lipoprotein LolB
MMLRQLSALAAVLAVAACAALGPREAVAPGPPFDILGRVLVSYDGRAFSSGLRWRHAPERDEIMLLTPVGQGLAHIVNGADGATLTAADQRRYHAASVEGLTRQALGWELPLAHLRYWVRGEPAPGSAPTVLERDASARLVRLEQDGWRIAFVNYSEHQHGGRPRRLELDRGTQRIRLVIDEWRAEP